MSAKAKTSIVLEERHRDWLQSEGGMSDAVAILIEQEIARREHAERQAEIKRAKLKPKERLLEAVADVFHVRRAARVASMKRSQVDRWLKDEDLVAQVIDRQEEFIEGLEALIIEAARGQRVLDRSAMQGLTMFLAQHAPNWGSRRLEEMRREFDPIFNELLRLVREEFGETGYQTIAGKFADVRDARLSTLRD